PRHDEVQHQELRRLGFEPAQRLFTVGGLLHFVAPVAQEARDEHTKAFFVVHDEDTGRGRGLAHGAGGDAEGEGGATASAFRPVTFWITMRFSGVSFTTGVSAMRSATSMPEITSPKIVNLPVRAG